MDVYIKEGGEMRLIGHAEVPHDCGPVFEAAIFGASAVLRVRFAIGTVPQRPTAGAPEAVVRAVLLGPGQHPDLLPGWRPVVN